MRGRLSSRPWRAPLNVFTSRDSPHRRLLVLAASRPPAWLSARPRSLVTLSGTRGRQSRARGAGPGRADRRADRGRTLRPLPGALDAIRDAADHRGLRVVGDHPGAVRRLAPLQRRPDCRLLVEPILIYLVLAYPSGRLRSATDRWLVAALVLIMGVLYLPTALLWTPIRRRRPGVAVRTTARPTRSCWPPPSPLGSTTSSFPCARRRRSRCSQR